MINLLLKITNNGNKSMHEAEWDIAFFIINTLALIFGISAFIIKGEWQWIPVLVIEYNWAMDNLRNNRDE